MNPNDLDLLVHFHREQSVMEIVILNSSTNTLVSSMMLKIDEIPEDQDVDDAIGVHWRVVKQGIEVIVEDYIKEDAIINYLIPMEFEELPAVTKDHSDIIN